jgi:glyoxylase-like metal-dependent hydrolase (beta-lactamase superfamily II)
MKLHVIDTGFFKLDGGAMFGVVPKSMWQKLNPADENNMCTWALRCLLVEEGDRLILIDTGIGDKQDEKFFSHYYLHGAASLEGSLKQAGFGFDDITDVVLTHLHFDHCGGAIRRKNDGFEPVFPKATYWSNPIHWDWAVKPNAREKASFLKDTIVPIQESGQLLWLSENEKSPFPSISFLFVDGHTMHQVLPLVHTPNGKVLFCADLFPSAAHIPIPYVMAYDMQPLLTLSEKEKVLKQALAEDWTLFFEHDPRFAAGKLVDTEKGIRIGETFDSLPF